MASRNPLFSSSPAPLPGKAAAAKARNTEWSKLQGQIPATAAKGKRPPDMQGGKTRPGENTDWSMAKSSLTAVARKATKPPTLTAPAGTAGTKGSASASLPKARKAVRNVNVASGRKPAAKPPKQ